VSSLVERVPVKAGDKPTIITFRQTGERNRYCKHNSEGNIERDEAGLAVMMSEAEIERSGLPVFDTTIKAFDGPNAVGYACDEFGATGVYVERNYQRQGIGTELLRRFRSQFAYDRQLGQMTHAGEQLSRAYYPRCHADKAIIAREGSKPEVSLPLPNSAPLRTENGGSMVR